MISDAPQEENEIVLQRNEIKPLLKQDRPSLWRRFISSLRETIGLKPLWLAERWAEAQVSSLEIDNEVKLLMAKAEATKIMAEAEQIRRGTANDRNESNVVDARAPQPIEMSPEAKRHISDSQRDPDELVSELMTLIERIEWMGGRVEFDFADRDSIAEMFADIEDELEQTIESDSIEIRERLHEGEIVRGRIVEIGEDRVHVDIGYKSEGVIVISEFSRPGDLVLGDEFDFYIDEPENELGMPVLSKQKADRIKNWEHVQKIYEDDGVIEGIITRRVKGGLKVDIGIDAFMPASQLTFRPTGDLEKFIGQKLELKIIKLTKRRRNVIVSRRKLLEEQCAGEKERLLKSIQVGATLTGEVKNITDFGAFVDVGGIDGLLHVTDMSWGRVKHPSQVVHVGQKIDVMVLSFDPQSERISLGLKQKSDNPWKTAADHYPVGSVVHGKVVSMTDYGAFVQIEPGIEGMLLVSEMSRIHRVRHPTELLQLGQEVDVTILTVEPDAEKITLRIKQTPEEAARQWAKPTGPKKPDS